MEGTTSCRLLFGCLSDPQFKKKSVCLVTAINAVSCKNYGLAKDVVSLYPYADVAGIRYTKPGVSYACQRDRGTTGTVILNDPPSEEHTDDPVVATLITQYGIGDSIETNLYARNSVQYSLDLHHVNNLREDTEDKRLTDFCSSMKELKEKLSKCEFDHIEYVLLPLGIGRRGKIDKMWLAYYLPCIFTFSHELEGKTVCFVANENVFSSLDVKFKGNVVMSNLLKPLKELQVMNNFFNCTENGEDTCGADRPPFECQY